MKYLPFIAVFVLLWPGVIIAQGDMGTFQQLPFVTDAANSTEDYISALYKISISIAAILVVLKLIFAGTKYILTDVVSTKGNAKDDIKNALLGLLIILAAVTILNTINPQITRTDIFRNATPTGGTQAEEQNGSPVAPGSSRCPSGQVWMECEGSSGVDGAGCFVSNNTNWCESQGGQVILGGN